MRQAVIAGAGSERVVTLPEADPEALLDEIESLLEEGQAFRHRTGLNFAAAKLCEKLKKYEDAFGHRTGHGRCRRSRRNWCSARVGPVP